MNNINFKSEYLMCNDEIKLLASTLMTDAELQNAEDISLKLTTKNKKRAIQKLVKLLSVPEKDPFHKRPLYYLHHELRFLPKYTRDGMRYLGDYIDQIVKTIAEEKVDPRVYNRLKFDIAIDCVALPTWESLSKSPDPTSLMWAKYIEQKGTKTFRMYDVVSIIMDQHKFVLGFIPLKDGDKSNKEIIVEKLILKAKSLINVGTVLMDKEYGTAAILTLLNSMKVNYLIPVKLTEDIMQLTYNMNDSIKFCDRIIGGKVVSPMIIFKEQKAPLEYKIIAFTTNLKVDKNTARKLLPMYRTRWNIETGFRDLKILKTLTTSRDTPTRNFFFGSATIIMNIWVLSNLITFFLCMKLKPKTPPITKIAFKMHSLGIRHIDSS